MFEIVHRVKEKTSENVQTTQIFQNKSITLGRLAKIVMEKPG